MTYAQRTRAEQRRIERQLEAVKREHERKCAESPEYAAEFESRKRYAIAKLRATRKH